MKYLANRPSVNGGLLDFPRSVDDLFNQFWGVRPAQTAAWRPAVDIVETPQAYVLRLEIPGINPDDVHVTLTGDTITIRGEKPMEAKLDDEAWMLSERHTGAFERTFTLPAQVSTENVEADAHNGVLTIKVMKAKEAQPQRIKIRTS